MEQYRFTNFYQILDFAIYCNPARAKSVNLLEVEKTSKRATFFVSAYIPLTGKVLTIEDENGLWAYICGVIDRTFKALGPNSPRVKVFRMVYLFPREYRLGPEQIADGDYPAYVPKHMRVSCSLRMVYYYLKDVREDLESQFRAVNLLPPNDDTQVH